MTQTASKTFPGEAGNTTVIGTSSVLASVNTARVGFGKYREERVCDVVADNPSYVLWAYENVAFFSTKFSDRDLAAARYLHRLGLGEKNAAAATKHYKQPERAQEGSLAKSRSHFDSADDIPF